MSKRIFKTVYGQEVEVADTSDGSITLSVEHADGGKFAYTYLTCEEARKIATTLEAFAHIHDRNI